MEQHPLPVPMEQTTETHTIPKTKLVDQELTENPTRDIEKEAVEDNCPQNPKCFDEIRPDYHENFAALSIKVEGEEAQQGSTCLDRVSPSAGIEDADRAGASTKPLTSTIQPVKTGQNQDESEPLTVFPWFSILPLIQIKQDEECNPGKQDDVLRNSKPRISKRDAYDKLSEPHQQTQHTASGVQDADKSQAGLVVDTCGNQDTNLIQQPGSKPSSRVDMLVCTLCDYEATEKHSLTRHMKEDHKSTVQSGSISQGKENISMEYRAEVPVHRSTGNLSKDVMVHHNEQDKSYKCPHCNFSFKSKHILKQHFKIQHNPHAKCLKCTHCNFETKHAHSLDRHVLMQHKPDAPLYRCAECDFATKRKDRLARHVNLKHNSDSPVYRCEKCNYVTKVKYNLTHHVNVQHNPDAPVHRCDKCNYMTKNKQDLSTHMKTHLNGHDKLHRCPHCNFTTMNKELITLHLKAQHNLDGGSFVCEFCSFVAKATWTLERHLTQKHNVNAV